MLRSLCSQGKEGGLSFSLRLVILQSPAGGPQFCQAFPETHHPSAPLLSDLLTNPLCSSEKTQTLRSDVGMSLAQPLLSCITLGKYLDLTGLPFLHLCNGNNHSASSIKDSAREVSISVL